MSTEPTADKSHGTRLSVPTLHAIEPASIDAQFASHDALVLLCAAPFETHLAKLALPGPVRAGVARALEVDASLRKGARPPAVLPIAEAPGGRVIIAPLATLTDDTDDVRLVSEASIVAAQRALDAGARAPLVYLSLPDDARYGRAHEVCAASLVASQWRSIEAREAGKLGPRIERFGVVGLTEAQARYAHALEVGRYLARDITGTEPERMAPARVAELCAQSFAGTSVRVSVEDDVSAYPLLSAVARASMVVKRHRPCVVRLEYVGAGPVEKTLFLAGKGVTYDTGGADLKTDGAMAGMSRDKGGAGGVAGLVRAVAELAPPNVRVVALLGMVRNSIGEESFVSDEVIASRAGVRVRIGNTDAEGRLVLADLLSALREEAARPDASSASAAPVLVSVATLTGHVYRAYGPYVGAIENGASRARGFVRAVMECGERWAEPFESTRVRREDYAFVAARSAAEDVVSSNRLASVATPRGHQGPFAFLDVASGIKNTGVALAHLDIGGAVASPVDWQFGTPTGAPVASLLAWLLGA